MSHPEQREFCETVKGLFPSKFIDVTVLDVGSVDINGSNRYLFTGNSEYIGLDIVAGKNVDIVCRIVDFVPEKQYDVVISTEMLEHDSQWKGSVQKMYSLVKSGGLLLITCAGTGRPVHGTFEHNPQDSPATLSYYKNISAEMLMRVLNKYAFKSCQFTENKKSCDTYFWGVKK